LTAALIGMVALVVVVASVVAYRTDREVSAPPSSSVRTPPITATKDSIEFTSRTGSGRLTIVEHSWQTAQSAPGSALEVRVRIVCTQGMIDYDPYDFQAFDAGGNLFDLAAEEVRGPLLSVGILEPGEDVTGYLAFVIPRGEVTLLMSDDASSVTALKIPD
jgi:hypothetical protein